MGFWQSFWLILGLVFIFSELLLPGGIAFFVGAGALFVAGLYFFGLVSNPLTGFTLWFVVSITFLFALKGLVDKFLPHTVTRSNADEDLDSFGVEVEVLSPVSHEVAGRIRHQGTSWPARSRRPGVEFTEGDKAVILFRDNLTWLIDNKTNNSNSKSN